MTLPGILHTHFEGTSEALARLVSDRTNEPIQKEHIS